MRRRALALCLTIALLAGCKPRTPDLTNGLAGDAPPRAAAGEPPPFQLVEASRERGIEFVHESGKRRPLGIVEALGSAAAVLDFDGDGWQDLLLLNAGQDFKLPRQEPRSKLYRNKGDGSFEDVTARSGLKIDTYAMGACVGDIDGDGHIDLLVTGFARNQLFRNNGNGTFTDITAKAGLLQRKDAWGMGCAMLDVNRDGKLDIFIANYVRYNPAIPLCRTANVWHGCTPNQYKTQPDELYINRGGGVFDERAQALGAADPDGAGLGVVACDFDDDGWIDIAVANDGTPNALLHNRKGRFVNVGHEAGMAFGEDGNMRAGMGIDAADIDGDGRFDLTITNFQNEVTAVYRNTGAMGFLEISNPSGVGVASLNHLKFGVAWVDLDGDGRLDLYQGNGHVYDNVHEFNDFDTFEQVDQAYRNLGEGRFKEVLPATGAFPATPSVTRSVSVADFNNDGLSDLVINSLNHPVRLLENRTKASGRWVGVALRGAGGNRSAIGARVTLTGPGGTLSREVRSGGGYLGQSDLRALFRLPADADPAQLKVRVRWPGGRTQDVRLEALDRYVTVEEKP